MRYDDAIFDTLLTAACGDARRRELAALDALDAGTDAPAFAPAPARRPRRLFTLAAAALCMALATGICAAWPTVELTFKNGYGYISFQNAAHEAEASQMTFGYMPEKWNVEWDGDSRAVISYRQKTINRFGKTVFEDKSFVITQNTQEGVVREISGLEGEPLTKEQQEEIKEVYVIAEDINQLTWRDITENPMLLWTTNTSFYQYYRNFGTFADKEEAENILKVLQNITP